MALVDGKVGSLGDWAGVLVALLGGDAAGRIVSTGSRHETDLLLPLLQGVCVALGSTVMVLFVSFLVVLCFSFNVEMGHGTRGLTGSA